jgi:hypothetical protein
MQRARWGLALIWFPAAGLFFLCLVLVSYLHPALAAERQRLWGWGLPNIIPTLSLMISVFAAGAVGQNKNADPFVQKGFYLLSMGISSFYFIIIFILLAIMPVVTFGEPDSVLIENLESSSIFLGPLQGLVAGSIGVLFFSKKEDAA